MQNLYVTFGYHNKNGQKLSMNKINGPYSGHVWM